MRTKTTGARRKSIGVAKPPKTPKTPKTSTAKSPATAQSKMESARKQPQELSARDSLKLKEWLNDNDKPFEVMTVPASRKRKRGSVHMFEVQGDLFEERLRVLYEVKPRNTWESLRRYKRFTVGEESIATGECILVKHDDSEETRIDTRKQWKAKVLEVRALDPEHVYIRVAWLNRPEDLDIGRKSYHGKNELIPSNQMDIIDAMAVNGGFSVRHWDEAADDDEQSMPEEEQYFWRQTYDHANTKTYSALRHICIDKAPQNPDELIVQCSEEACRKWMHVRCIAEQAVQRAMKDASKPQRASKAAKRKSKSNKDSIGSDPSAVAVAAADGFLAEVLVKGHPDRLKAEPATEDAIIITDAEGEKRSERMCCLFCGTEVD